MAMRDGAAKHQGLLPLTATAISPAGATAPCAGAAFCAIAAGLPASVAAAASAQITKAERRRAAHPRGATHASLRRASPRTGKAGSARPRWSDIPFLRCVWRACAMDN